MNFEFESAKRDLNSLKQGAFLTTLYDGKLNTMTIGWGGICFMWYRPVFMVMVRKSRFTYELLEKSGEFTVSLPYTDIGKVLSICGTKSGRDIDKITTCSLNTVQSQKIYTPVLDFPGSHYECKVIYKEAMNKNNLNSEIDQALYDSDNYHTIYYGEILAAYEI